MAIALYFAVLVVVVWWAVAQKQKSSADYFLAGRHMGWFVIGSSLFASNIGSEHIVGLAGSGAESGVAMAHYELHAWLLLVLGWVFVPFYTRSGVFTMPEFLEKRYSPASRWFLSLISLIAYVLTKVSVALYAAGIVFKALFPNNFIEGVDNFWLGALSIVVLTGLYTILGGLRSCLHRRYSGRRSDSGLGCGRLYRPGETGRMGTTARGLRQRVFQSLEALQ